MKTKKRLLIDIALIIMGCIALLITNCHMTHREVSPLIIDKITRHSKTLDFSNVNTTKSYPGYTLIPQSGTEKYC